MVRELELTVLADDGAIVYLNGVEAHRFNLPAGPVTPTTLAAYDVRQAEEPRPNVSRLDPSLLVPGPNVLAVEVHQSSRASRDLRFDLELVARP